MASTQKSPPKRASSGKTQTKTKKKQSPKKKQHVAVLWERLTGGLLCILLAMFLVLHMFGIKALVIDIISAGIKGCMGYGFYMAIPALLLSAYLFLFCVRERITLRVWCALLSPFMVGALFHVFLDTDLYQLSVGGIQQLWMDGQDLSCGGAIGGFLAVLFTQLFSSIGASVIFLLLLATLILAALHITPEAIMRSIRLAVEEFRASRAYDDWDDEDYYEDEEEKPQPASRMAPPRPKRQAVVDIPVDEPPIPSQPQERPPRRSLFNKEAKVKRPDEVLSELAQTEPEEKSSNLSQPVETSVASPSLDPELLIHTAPPVAPLIVKAEAPAPAPAPTPATAPPAASPSPERELSKSERKELIREHQEAVAKDVATILETSSQAEYQYPSVNLLHEATLPGQGAVQEELTAIQKRLSDTISSFGIVAHITGAVRGPSITRYELELEQGVRLNKLTNLADDIALALGAASVRIAPVPGKISLVGIEVPNQQITPVPIREVIESQTFSEHTSKVSFSVGKDIGGNYIIGDIAKLPHLLIAGTTGSGKSVCTNSLIISLLYKATPDEVRLIMVDPKMVELGIYNGIPHLLIPVVTDPKKAAGALQWAVVEMMKRYRMFSEVGVRDLASYNAYAVKTGSVQKLPQIVVVIDELADLMLVAAKEVEESICRVAQMGRASGMHLIIATQRPSADVITGLMKANIPSRIAFAVASSLESRIILDTQGAEKLVGKGDMLWFPLGSGKPLRVQGCLISDQDVASVVAFVKESGDTAYDEAVLQEIEQHAQEQGKGSKSSSTASSDSLGDGDEGDYDELFPDAVSIVLELGQASVSMLQRRLKLGYSRAARLVDQMEDRGIVGPFEGSKPRQLLVTREQWDVMQGKTPPQETAPTMEAAPDDNEMEMEPSRNDEVELKQQESLPPWNEEEL